MWDDSVQCHVDLPLGRRRHRGHGGGGPAEDPAGTVGGARGRRADASPLRGAGAACAPGRRGTGSVPELGIERDDHGGERFNMSHFGRRRRRVRRRFSAELSARFAALRSAAAATTELPLIERRDLPFELTTEEVTQPVEHSPTPPVRNDPPRLTQPEAVLDPPSADSAPAEPSAEEVLYRA